MSDRRTVFEIAAVYTAVIIGAGFATGRELISFFLRYDEFAMHGLVLSGVLMGLVGWAVLEVCRQREIASFDGLLEYVAGRYVGAFIKAGAVAFLFVIFVAMLSASGALGAQLFGVPELVGAVVLCMLSFAAFSFGMGGLVRFNTVLAPVMVLGSIGLGLYTYYADTVGAFSILGDVVPQNWVGSALVYASYNMITVISVLTAMSVSVRRRRVALLGIVMGASAVTLIAVSLSLGLSRGLDVVSDFQIPFLRLVQDYGVILQWLYVGVLAIAIYTTAIANGYCFYMGALGKLHLKPGIVKAAMCGVALVFSQIEFSRIVEGVYPVFGVLGMFLALILIITMLARRDGAC